MPNKKGELSSADKRAVLESLKKLDIDYERCPVCDGTELTVYPGAYALMLAGDLGRGIVVVSIGCTRCGHMRLFNGRYLGVSKVEEWTDE